MGGGESNNLGRWQSWMMSTAVSITTEDWEKLTWHPVGNWTHSLWRIHTITCYTATKRNELATDAPWASLSGAMLSAGSQMQWKFFHSPYLHEERQMPKHGCPGAQEHYTGKEHEASSWGYGEICSWQARRLRDCT